MKRILLMTRAQALRPYSEFANLVILILEITQKSGKT